MPPGSPLLSLRGVFAYYKPRGKTSTGLLADIKRHLFDAYGVQEDKEVKKAFKIGHGGTLDPMAEGVLPIGINGGCKWLSRCLAGTKVYQVECVFGYETDTLDVTGVKVQEDKTIQDIPLEQIQAVLPRFIGTIQQVPPR